MKTTFTLLSSLLIGAAVMAAPVDHGSRQKSMLTVRSMESRDIRVEIDGRRFESSQNSVQIAGLQPGTHNVRVFRARNNGLFNVLGSRYEMVYSTTLMIRAKTHVRILIDRYGRTSIDERRIRGNYRDFDRDRDRRDNDWDADRSYDFDHDGRMGDYDRNYGYERGMDDREFNRLLESIDKEWLETNKLKSATQVVRTNSFTSAQVKQLVLMFSFENNKLELAKQAYNNTVDKKNYYIINDAFSFNSSKDELARFIRNAR